jgi:hypothetical protein
MQPLRRGLLVVLGPLALVLLSTAAGLVLLNAAAGVFAGPPKDRTFPTLPELERAIGRRLTVPTYFPSSVSWPPESIRLWGSPPGAAVLRFVSSEGRPRLVFAQGLKEGQSLPADAAVAGFMVEHVATRVGMDDAVLSRVRAEDGVLWHQLQWRRGGRDFLMRSNGALEELLKMAASVHPVQP